jgi:hypothetical protein
MLPEQAHAAAKTGAGAGNRAGTCDGGGLLARLPLLQQSQVNQRALLYSSAAHDNKLVLELSPPCLCSAEGSEWYSCIGGPWALRNSWCSLQTPMHSMLHQGADMECLMITVKGLWVDL